MKPIYLDYNATTPIDPRVAESMLPFLNEHFGNPSSSHLYGAAARMAVETARRQVADMLHCAIDEIVFTSGGTESNNYAIKGAAFANRSKGSHIITSAIEHPAVLEVCHFLEEKGFKITYLSVDEFGLIDVAEVERAITPQTILISIMQANNEVGAIQPVAEIAEIARKHNILVHSDCAQSIGKIPVWVDELGVDLLSIAGHKLYAPKGVGALYIRRGVKLEKQMHGANHEMNWRAGTENVIEIVGLGKAGELIGQDFKQSMSHLKNLRDHLEQSILGKFSDCRVNGHPEKRLPNTSSICFKGLEANTIVAELSDNVAVSAGAACHSDHVDVSSVLQAMKVPVEYAMGAIRFSVGRFSTRQEIDHALQAIIPVIERLRPTDAALHLKTDTDKIRLTQYTHGLGCACKLRPQLLEAVLKNMPAPQDANILVGVESSDDAAVYKIDENTAIVQTVDFFTPIVDDPFRFGVIAAVNSLSDIYAMGARPLFALNIVGFPSNRLPMEVLEQILMGAQSVAEQAGISIIGGHTVDDTEPKFGLAVTGVAHPQKIVTNKGAQAGDVLILTKPIGTGILSTAAKQGLLVADRSDRMQDRKKEHERENDLFRVMARLNKDAAEAMQAVGAHACTDVTGFGLLGHLLEMMNGAQTSAQIDFHAIPFLPGVLESAIAGAIPGGTRDNFEFTKPSCHYAGEITPLQQLLLNDAQTSGGLLIAVAEEKAEELKAELRLRQVPTIAVIGRVLERGKFPIIIK